MSGAILIRQFRAELLKARRRSLFFGVLAVMLAFAILPLGSAIAALRHPGSVRDWAVDFVRYPGCLLTTLRSLHFISAILISFVAAATVASEYAGSTWKMVLPRSTSRLSPLLARMATVFVLGMLGWWITIALTIAGGASGALLLHVPFAKGSVTTAEWVHVHAFLTLELMLMIAMATFWAVVTRSTVGATLLALLSENVLRLLTFVPLGWLLPVNHLDALYARWVPDKRLMLDDVEAALGHHTTWQLNAALVIGFAFVFAGVSAWIFQKRDLASES